MWFLDYCNRFISTCPSTNWKQFENPLNYWIVKYSFLSSIFFLLLCFPLYFHFYYNLSSFDFVWRIIRVWEVCYVECSKKPNVLFNIMTNLYYHKMKLFGDEATITSPNATLGRNNVRRNVINWEEEDLLLNINVVFLSHSYGIDFKWLILGFYFFH